MWSLPARPMPRLLTKTARSLFSGASATPQLALNEAFPELPSTHPQPARVGTVTVSTTKKGLKLASDTSDAFVSTLGIEIAAGSRVETEATAGLSALAAKMAFRATLARTDLRLYRDVEAIGGVLHKAAGRDFVRYSISVLPDKLEKAAAVLAETTLAPRFAAWDIDEVKKHVKVDALVLAECGQQSVLEALHAAAFYDDHTLGRPRVTTENLDAFDAETLQAFHAEYVNTAGLALVGSGVDHNVLGGLAMDWFRELPVVTTPLQQTKAKYVGGELRLKQHRERTSVALGFSTVGRNDKHYGAAKVLQALLTHRLNTKTAQSFLCGYEEVGVIGFVGDAAPSEAGAMVDAFVTQIKSVATSAPSKEDLAIAKVSAALAEDSEQTSRQERLATLGRLALTQTKSKSTRELIDGVTAADVQELAKSAIQARPSLASVGKLSTVPHLDAIEEKLQQAAPKKPAASKTQV